MPLQENLEFAREALHYVQSLGIRSSNIRSHRVAAAGGMDALVGGRSTSNTASGSGPLGNAVGLMRNPLAHFPDHYNTLDLEHVLHHAALARAHRVGNCDELCALAMEFFYTRGMGPVGLMETKGFSFMRTVGPRLERGHTFIVVGLDAGWDRWSAAGPRTNLMTRNLRDWGPDAVWLDVWQSGGIVFPVADLIRGEVRNLDFHFGLHTAEAVQDSTPRCVLRLGRNLI